MPKVWTLENYIEIIGRVNFPAAFSNSTLQATSVTLCSALTSAALGFIFAKYRFWGKEKLFTLLLSTMMIPFAVVLVPLYITIADLKMSNHLSGIIVTGLWSSFGLFLMRQFMESIPSELLDAARIDGASEWRIFFTIVLPMATSALAALIVFIFLFNWDNFLWPLVVLNSPEKQTLPLVLAGLRSLYWTRYEMWAAGSMLTVVPVMPHLYLRIQVLHSRPSHDRTKGIAALHAAIAATGAAGLPALHQPSGRLRNSAAITGSSEAPTSVLVRRAWPP